MRSSIRPFLISDYVAAKGLWLATPGVGLSDADEREQIERFLARNPGSSFVAESGTAIVGTVLCGHDGRRGLIHHLVVASEWRRRGVGCQLLAEGLRALRAQGIAKCHLLVFRNNADGLAFWRGLNAVERNELALFSIDTRDTNGAHP